MPSVAKAINPGTKSKSHDLLKLAEMETTGEYDLVLAATPCKGFSTVNNAATGMAGNDGKLMEAAAKIINKVRRNNPRVKILMENVRINEKFAHQAEAQDRLIGIPFKEVTASSQGASQIRARRIATNITDVLRLEPKDMIDPNALLGNLAQAKLRTTPCIMAAGSATKAPVIVRHGEGSQYALASNYEKEALQGYPMGMSCGYRYNEGDISEDKRSKIIGNVWNYHQMCGIFRKLRLPEHEKKASVHRVQTAGIQGISKLERSLLEMGDEEQYEWLMKKKGDYELPMLHVTLADEQTIPYQVPKNNRMHTQAAKKPAAMAEIKLRMRRGHIQLVKHEREQWIANMFCKGKDRINPDTGLEAIRLLTDFRRLNAAITWPVQWNEECPTIEGIRQAIPHGSKWFASEDLSDAYESATVHPSCRHLLTAAPPVKLKASDFTDEELEDWGIGTKEELKEADELYLQWSGMPQGLSVSATFFGGHLADGMNKLLGEEWRKLWSIYVDDAMITGTTEKHCQMRQALFRNVMKVLGKKLSTKGDREVKQYGLMVGLKITEHGIEPDDGVVAALEAELKTRPKSLKEMRRLIGIILYSSGAFEWSDENLTWWAETMKPLHEATTKGQLTWTEECQRSLEELSSKMGALPRAYSNPDGLITDDTCLVLMSDASDIGVGSALWHVKRADASEVTIEDLQDHTISTIIATDAKVLSQSEQNWFTFEQEIYATYRGIKKWGGLLIQATQGYPKGGTPKISIRLDNTTATKAWMDMQEPTVIEHAGAKEMRILGWAERVSFIKDLPTHTAYCPGELNCFGDLVSRVAMEMGEAARAKKEERKKGNSKQKPAEETGGTATHTARKQKGKKHRAKVTNRCSVWTGGLKGEAGWRPPKEKIHGPKKVSAGGELYSSTHLHMTKSEAEGIAKATLGDTTKIHGVTVSDIYKCAMGGEKVPSEVRNKIDPWIGRSFFALEHPTAKVKLLYTTSWCTRERETKEDPSKTLVIYAPKGAKVQLVSQDMPELEEGAPEWLTEQQELRGQILIMCHDNSGHPTCAQTEVQVKAVAYWRGMDEDIRRHIHTCADCLPEIKAQKKIGTGIISIQRFVCMQIDHFVLKAEWQRACGVHDILTLTDMATRITSYEVAESQRAIETARIIHDRWIPYYTTPDEIVSDGHPAFASEVMAELRQILGIRGHDLATPGAKGKTAMVESRHNLLSMTLADGFAKGDIRNARDLQTYCSKAKRRWDHDSNKEVTPFECVTGQKPRSVRSLAFVPENRKEVICMHLRQRGVGLTNDEDRDSEDDDGHGSQSRQEERGDHKRKCMQENGGCNYNHDGDRSQRTKTPANGSHGCNDDSESQRTDISASECCHQTPIAPYSLGETGVEVPPDPTCSIFTTGDWGRGDSNEMILEAKEKIVQRTNIADENMARQRLRARSHALREPPGKKIRTLHKTTSTRSSTKHEMSENEWLRWIREDEVMEGDRPTRRSVEEQPEEGDGSFMMKDKKGKAQAIFRQAEEKVMQNVLARDRAARDNILSRQRKNSKAPYVVDFQLSVGDEVSFDGTLHNIRSVNGPPGEAITSTIQNKDNGKTRRVRVSELRPTATPRPTTFLTRDSLNYGDFVFYEGEEEVRGGRITCNDDDDAIVVHIFEGTAGTLAMWLPAWTNKKSEHKRAKKQPAGFARLEETVDRQDIIMTGRLTATDRMTASTIKEAVNRGILTNECHSALLAKQQ